MVRGHCLTNGQCERICSPARISSAWQRRHGNVRGFDVWAATAVNLPSISDHAQNRGYQEWTALIELVREAWYELVRVDGPAAKRAAHSWWSRPHLVFKRLAIHAGTWMEELSDTAAHWLIAEPKYLWIRGTTRETMRFLAERGDAISPARRAEIEHAIAAGPPVDLFRQGIDEELRETAALGMIARRLGKLDLGRVKLAPEARALLDRLLQRDRSWTPRDDQSDEFATWMTSSWEAGYVSPFQKEILPRDANELADRLGRPRDTHPLGGDDWDEMCRVDARTALSGLSEVTKCEDLTPESRWPEAFWRTALFVWSDPGDHAPPWLDVAAILAAAPEEFFGAVRAPLSYWLERFAKDAVDDDKAWLVLCDKVLNATLPCSAKQNRPRWNSSLTAKGQCGRHADCCRSCAST